MRLGCGADDRRRHGRAGNCSVLWGAELPVDRRAANTCKVRARVRSLNWAYQMALAATDVWSLVGGRGQSIGETSTWLMLDLPPDSFSLGFDQSSSKSMSMSMSMLVHIRPSRRHSSMHVTLTSWAVECST
jgi:hypothetical protein